jgi:hypothetical protein
MKEQFLFFLYITPVSVATSCCIFRGMTGRYKSSEMTLWYIHVEILRRTGKPRTKSILSTRSQIRVRDYYKQDERLTMVFVRLLVRLIGGYLNWYLARVSMYHAVG